MFFYQPHLMIEKRFGALAWHTAWHTTRILLGIPLAPLDPLWLEPICSGKVHPRAKCRANTYEPFDRIVFNPNDQRIDNLAPIADQHMANRRLDRMARQWDAIHLER